MKVDFHKDLDNFRSTLVFNAKQVVDKQNKKQGKIKFDTIYSNFRMKMSFNFSQNFFS